MEVAMVEKLLASTGEMRAIMAAHKSGKRALPVYGQAFEPFEKLPVQNGRVCQGKPRLDGYAADACTVTPEMIDARRLSGVLPSA